MKAEKEHNIKSKLTSLYVMLITKKTNKHNAQRKVILYMLEISCNMLVR